MNSTGTPIRAFIALETPDEVGAILARTQDRLRGALGSAERAVRWVRPEGIHLTLQFLGDVPSSRVGAIGDALQQAAAGIQAARLRLGATGVFPNPSRPRVVWAGLEGDIEELHRLEQSIAQALLPLGYRPDKSFKPHLTLGRVRDSASPQEVKAIGALVSGWKPDERERASFVATTVALMQSHLQPGGSVYTPLRHVTLG